MKGDTNWCLKCRAGKHGATCARTQQNGVTAYCHDPLLLLLLLTAGCVNMDGLGELELVTGKNSVCSGCRVARLCSKNCLKAHWIWHKPVCKRIAASSKAAGK
jgi:hypothetical protein